MPVIIGSMCTGYGGLDAAVVSLFGGEVAWVADNDKGAAAVLAHRYPEVPNLGDIRTVAWEDVPPVDVLCAGFPCQPVSAAGKQKGMKDDRWLWPDIDAAVRRMAARPWLLVLENVPRLLSISGGDAMSSIIGSLAEMGYVGRYGLFRAGDAGAPHRRERLFILAADPDVEPVRPDGRAAHGDAQGVGPAEPQPARGGGAAAADAGGQRLDGGPGVVGGGRHPAIGREACGDPRHGGGVPGDAAAADAQGLGRPEVQPHFRRKRGNLTEAVADLLFPDPLLPTCTAGDATASGSRNLPGSQAHAGVSLTDAVLYGGSATPRHLLKTPTAQLAVNGGSQHPDKRRAGGHGPTLDDQVSHEITTELLPTPAAADGGGGMSSRSGARKGELLIGGIARDVLSVDWGKYAGAIRRWEAIRGVPAPSPTEPGKNGQPRLSPAFSEWMMGLPPGWVTDVPGLSRSAQLKAIGNGVVPQQALMALAELYGIST